MTTAAQKPYVYDLTLRCRSGCAILTRSGIWASDTADDLPAFRAAARRHAEVAGHEVEVIVGTVHAYERVSAS